MKSTRKIRTRNFGGALVIVAIAFGLSYAIVASIERVEVPQNGFALVKRKPLLYFFGSPRIEELPTGIHSTTSDGEIFFIPVEQPHKLEFKCYIDPGLYGKHAPKILGGGKSGLLVQGAISVVITHDQASKIVAKNAEAVEKVYLEPLSSACTKHRELFDKKQEFAEAVLNTVVEVLPLGFGDSVDSIEITEAKSVDAPIESSITEYASKLKPLDHVPAALLLRFFSVPGIFAGVLLMLAGFYPRGFNFVTGVIVAIPLAFLNLFGAAFDAPFDFDGPDFDIDLDIDL